MSFRECHSPIEIKFTFVDNANGNVQNIRLTYMYAWRVPATLNGPQLRLHMHLDNLLLFID